MTPKKPRGRPATTATPPQRTQSFLRPSTAKQVIIDDQSGMIYTNLGPDYGVVRMSKADHELFLQDYSRHYGPALDQNEMAIRWGFPGAHAVAEFVRIHQIRHTSIPFTDEGLETRGVASAIDEAVIQKRRDYLVGYQKAVNTQLKQDAAKYHLLEDSLREVARELALAPARPVTPLALERAKRPFTAVLGLSDLHYGKVAIGADGHEEYNLEIARERALSSTTRLLGKVAANGQPEALYLLIGSDGMHFDTKGKTTTKGTFLAVSSVNGGFARIVAGYAELMKDVVDQALALGCPLRLVVLPGNHDFVVSVMLALILREAYLDHPLVTFIDQPDEPVVFSQIGEITFAFNHGEQVKEKSLHREFVTASRTRGVTLTQTLVMVSAHLHHLKILDCDGVDWIQLPSPAGHDDYHKESMYNHARPGAAAVVYSLGGDLEDTYHVRF